MADIVKRLREHWSISNALAVTAERKEAAAEITRLRAAMYEANNILGGLSMGTTGHLRGRICSVSNRLGHALGRTISSHGDQPCEKCSKFDDCTCTHIAPLPPTKDDD